MNLMSSDFDITQHTCLKYHGSFIISAFCGTGKTAFVTNYPCAAIEYECWKYQTKNFPHNYVRAIHESIGTKQVIFISTNPPALHRLNVMGIPVIMVLPALTLQKEYTQRFLQRGSDTDFVQMINQNWASWLVEAYSEPNNLHIILSSGEYVSDVLRPLIMGGLI